MAWELCSREDVLSIAHVPESMLEDLWSDMVEGLIRQHMGLPNLGHQVAVTGEEYDGDGTHYILVKQPPIVSVQALRVDGYEIPAGEFRVSKYGLKLRYRAFPPGVLNVSVDYTSGSPDVDGEYQVDSVTRLAATTMIVAILNYKQRAGADASIKWGTLDPAEGEENPNQRVGLTSHLHAIMRRILKRERIRVR